MKVWLIAALALLAGCVDLSAVTKFSQAAPDVTKLDTLTDVYVSDPQIQSYWESVWLPNDPSPAPTMAQRAVEKVAFDELHALIVGYMKALGGLSDPKLTDLSAQAKAVSTNLAAPAESEQSRPHDRSSDHNW